MPNVERTQMIIRETSVRMTPPPASRQFRDALAQSGRTLLESAVSAAAYLPGGPLVAAAVRGAILPALQPITQGRTASTAEMPAPGTQQPAGSASGTSIGASMALGGSTGSASSLGGTSGDGAAIGTAVTGANGGSTGSNGSLGNDDMLARGQEMSMQMLRLQEAMGEENRRYTALSNVLHARHEMAKNAIGNIR